MTPSEMLEVDDSDEEKEESSEEGSPCERLEHFFSTRFDMMLRCVGC